MKVLSVILARSGSKGVPGKNLRQIGGLPLVGFKARAIQRAAAQARSVVSTDDPEIAKVAEKYDVEVPFIRPKELATDSATMFSALKHVVNYYDSIGESFDAVFLQEPSSPFTRPEEIDFALGCMIRNNASLVVSLKKLHNALPFIGPLREDGNISSIITQLSHYTTANRQSLPAAYSLNGIVYLIKCDLIRNSPTFYCDKERSYGFISDPNLSIEIDNEIDLQWATFLVEKGIVDMSIWL